MIGPFAVVYIIYHNSICVSNMLSGVYSCCCVEVESNVLLCSSSTQSSLSIFHQKLILTKFSFSVR